VFKNGDLAKKKITSTKELSQIILKTLFATAENSQLPAICRFILNMGQKFQVASLGHAVKILIWFKGIVS
jgi:hypothetical protein